VKGVADLRAVEREVFDGTVASHVEKLVAHITCGTHRIWRRGSARCRPSTNRGRASAASRPDPESHRPTTVPWSITAILRARTFRGAARRSRLPRGVGPASPRARADPA